MTQFPHLEGTNLGMQFLGVAQHEETSIVALHLVLASVAAEARLVLSGVILALDLELAEPRDDAP